MRANTWQLQSHRRGIYRGEIKEQRAAIHVTAAIATIHEIFVTAPRESGLPVTSFAGIDVGLWVLGCKQDGASRGIANGNRLSEQGLLRRRWIKGLAFLNTNSRGHPQQFR